MPIYKLYEAEKARWLRLNPGATPEEIEEAFKRIAKRFGV